MKTVFLAGTRNFSLKMKTALETYLSHDYRVLAEIDNIDNKSDGNWEKICNHIKRADQIYVIVDDGHAIKSEILYALLSGKNTVLSEPLMEDGYNHFVSGIVGLDKLESCLERHNKSGKTFGKLSR